MKKLAGILFVMLAVTSCSPLDIAKTLLGGGPNVAAQVGKTNNQGVNISQNTAAPTVTVRPKGRIDNLDQSQTTIQDTSPLVLLLLVIGWLAPSPGEIGRSIKLLFKRR